MFYLFFFAHLVADFVLQPLWLVRRKRYWHGLLIHVGLVLLCMLALPLAEPAALALWPWMLLIAGLHLAADWWKIHRADAMVRLPIVAFLLDQIVHIGTLALVLSAALPPAEVWSLDAFGAARGALVGGAYIIVAFAVPIGLIVALDPAFQHAGGASMARFRALIMTSGVLALTLVGGAWTLPVMLIGVALTNNLPALHPLDTPRGRLAMMIVAAVVGTGLTWV